MASEYTAHLCLRVVGPEAECHVVAIVHCPGCGYVGLICLCVHKGQPSAARVEICTPYHLHGTGENLGDRADGGVGGGRGGGGGIYA